MCAMPTTGIKLVLDHTQYVANANQVEASNRRMMTSVGAMERQLHQASVAHMQMDRLPQRWIFTGMDLAQVSRTMTMSVTAPFIAGTAAAVKFAGDFENNMRNVNSIAQLSEGEFYNLKEAVLAISASPTVVSGPAELAKGLYDIYSSGFEAARALNILKISSEAAAAGLTTTDVASKAIVGVLNAYGKEAITAQQASDILFRTVDKGIITFEELASNLGEVLSPAARANIDLTDLGAAIIQMTRAGIQPASAITYLTRAIEAIVNPTAEAKEFANELGISWGINALRAKGFIGVLQELERVTQGNEEAMTTMIGEARASRAMFSILRDSGQGYLEMQELLTDEMARGGATARAQAEQLKSPGMQLQDLKAQVEATGDSFGKIFIPTLIDATKSANTFFAAIADMPDQLKAMAIAFAAIPAAVGPLTWIGAQYLQFGGTILNVNNFLELARKSMDDAAVAENALAAAARNSVIATSEEVRANQALAEALLHTNVARQQAIAAAMTEVQATPVTGASEALAAASMERSRVAISALQEEKALFDISTKEVIVRDALADADKAVSRARSVVTAETAKMTVAQNNLTAAQEAQRAASAEVARVTSQQVVFQHEVAEAVAKEGVARQATLAAAQKHTVATQALTGAQENLAAATTLSAMREEELFRIREAAAAQALKYAEASATLDALDVKRVALAEKMLGTYAKRLSTEQKLAIADVIAARNALQVAASTEARARAADHLTAVEEKLAAVTIGLSEAELGAARSAIINAESQAEAAATAEAQTLAQMQLTQALQRGTLAAAGNAAATASVGNAAKITLGSVFNLRNVMSGVMWGTFAAAALWGANELVNIKVQADLAGASLGDLAQRYQRLRREEEEFARETREAAEYGGVPNFIPQVFRARELEEIEKQLGLRKVPDAVKDAINELETLQLKFKQEAAVTYTEELGRLKNALETDLVKADPRLKAQIEDAINDLYEGGVDAATESAYKHLSQSSKDVLDKWLEGLQVMAGITGAAGQATIQEMITQTFKPVGGRAALRIDIPVRLSAITEPQIADIEQKVNDEETRIANEVKVFTERMKEADDEVEAVNKTLKAHKRVVDDAQKAYQAAQENLSMLKDELSNARDALETFVDPALEGMREFENQIFETSMAIAGLELQLVQSNAAWAPVLADAERSVLETRLAYLTMGEAAESAGKQAEEAVFDLAAAQRRELREGTVVAKQYADWLADQEGRAGKSGTAREETTQEKNYRLAQKALEILQAQKALAQHDLKTRKEALGYQEQELNLTKQTTYEPMLHTLQQMADTAKEITFEEAKKGVADTIKEIERLNKAVGEAEGVSKSAEMYLKNAQDAQDQIQRELDTLRDAADVIREELEAANDASKLTLDQLQKEIQLLKDLQNTPPVLTTSHELDIVGKVRLQTEGELDPFYPGWAPPQAEPTPVDVNKVIGDALGGMGEFIGDRIEDFLKLRRPPGTENIWQPFGRAEGGIIPGSPGEQRVVIAEAGERFMGNQGPTEQNWNVTLNNYHPQGDMLRQLRRYATLKRLTRGSWN